MAHTISYGSPDQGLVNDAIANFTDAKFATLSFCTTPVEILSFDGKDSVIAHGTGFFWHHAGIDFVVTNWHVLSGRNPFTLELMSDKAIIPDRIRIFGWEILTENGQVEFKRASYTYALGEFGREAFAKPPMIGGKVVDIVALPVPPGFAMTRGPDAEGYRKLPPIEPRVNMRAQDKIATEAGDDCVLLGYPLANYSRSRLPIWKRGSIATDTNMAIDGSPAFLIDAATSSAMSGSPVFRRASTAPTVHPETKVVSQFHAVQFIGVYAGRLQSKELSAINVGYCWFANQVDAAVAEAWKIWQAVAEEKSASLAAEAGTEAKPSA